MDIRKPDKVIVCGGRKFSDKKANKDLMKKVLDTYRSTFGEIDVVSGRSVGADLLGEEYARANNLTIHKYPAKWQTDEGGIDKSAGAKRNSLMANNADACIAFWNLKSRGTKDMIEKARKKGMPVLIIYCDYPDSKRTNSVPKGIVS